jgi:putative transposase
MANYRRNSIPGGTYFFTANLADRNQTLLLDEIDKLRDSINKVKNNIPLN